MCSSMAMNEKRYPYRGEAWWGVAVRFATRIGAFNRSNPVKHEVHSAINGMTDPF